MEVLVLGNNTNILKVFNSVDEFNLYYTKNKEEMDNSTTQKLNKMYKITGYRITKKDTRDKDGKLQKGIICLKKIKEETQINEVQELKKKFEEMEKQHRIIEQKITVITERFNNLLDKLNHSLFQNP